MRRGIQGGGKYFLEKIHLDFYEMKNKRRILDTDTFLNGTLFA